MKKLILFLALNYSLSFICPAQVANIQKDSNTLRLTADFKVGTGRTVTFESGSSISLAGTDLFGLLDGSVGFVARSNAATYDYVSEQPLSVLYDGTGGRVLDAVNASYSGTGVYDLESTLAYHEDEFTYIFGGAADMAFNSVNLGGAGTLTCNGITLTNDGSYWIAGGGGFATYDLSTGFTLGGFFGEGGGLTVDGGDNISTNFANIATEFSNIVSGSQGVGYAYNADYATVSGYSSSADHLDDGVGHVVQPVYKTELSGNIYESDLPFAAPTLSTGSGASPPTHTANGVAGQMYFTDTFTYRCFGNNDWRRVAVTYSTY